MIKRLPLFFYFLILSLFATAQQNNYWYFGRQAGLNFNTVGTQPVPTALQNSAMTTDEGCSTISDQSGNLLFYTNGVTVYNKNHQIMLNGDGLAGNISGCQSAIIVPQPGTDSLFYIFTTDAIESNFVKGYNYSIVNTKRDNGNGEVVVKNQLLWQSCTERLTAARHANGVDVWLITNDNNSNIFRSWLISCTGLQTTPVVSIAGVILNYSVLTNTGFMKVSPDGKQLCQTHFPLDEIIVGVSNFIQLFDFNNVTGQVTNGKSITTPNAQYIGCEYSPDSKLLYITRTDQRKIDQLEAKLNTVAAIEASAVSIATTGGLPFGIQLGPDEKIYVFKQNQTVGVISNPNVKAPNVGFNETQISTAPHSAHLSSPSFINDVAYDANNTFDYSLVGTCNGQVQFNSFTSMPGIITWEWDFGDGLTSVAQNPLHTFTPDDRLYYVTLTMSSSLSCATIKRSRFVKPGGTFGAVDFDFIVRCDSDYVRFTNTSQELLNNNIQFVWDFGDGTTSTDLNPIHTFNSVGQYDVKLTTTSGNNCSIKEIVKQINIEQFQISASQDVTVLIGGSVFLSVTGPVANYKWTPSKWLLDSASKSVVASPLEDIVYKVIATDADGCSAEDSVFIKVLQYNDIYIPNAFTPNNDGRNDLLRPYYPGTINLKEFSLFNRWGNKIFATSQRGSGWDGKLNSVFQPAGVYVWTFSAIDEKTQKVIHRKGTVVLIR